MLAPTILRSSSDLFMHSPPNESEVTMLHGTMKNQRDIGHGHGHGRGPALTQTLEEIG